jgi:thioredoxin-related protein
MKIILIVLILSFSLFGAKIDDYALEMNFSRDYDSAFAKAKKENKPLMLILISDDCAWCTKLERSTLNTKEVKKRLLDTVPVIMNQNYDKGNFPEIYLTKTNPTIFFIDPKQNKKFYENVGYLKKNDFLLMLNDMQAAFKK